MAHLFIIRRAILLVASTVSLLFFWVCRWETPNNHRYNDFSCPGHIAPSISVDHSPAEPVKARLPEGNLTLPDFSPSPFAYVWYATSPEYACSVLINIDRLNNIFHTPHRIIVIVKPSLPSEYLSKFTAQNATVIPYQPPPLAAGNGYYTDVLLKLVGFRLHQYIPSLQRILILDSDQLILQSLDHLFLLPDTDVAAPRMYWGDNPSTLTSALILVKLSDRLWNRVETAIHGIRANRFDMEIVNDLFQSTALVLPGSYCTLNSQWETNTLPSWWQGIEPPQDPSSNLLKKRPSSESSTTISQIPPPPPRTQQPSRFLDLDHVYNTNDPSDLNHVSNPEPDDLDHISNPDDVSDPSEPSDLSSLYQDLPPPNLAPQTPTTQDNPNLRTLLESIYYQEVKVLHYTAYGKPWTSVPEEVEGARPSAHWLFAEQFRVWRGRAEEVCPAGWDEGGRGGRW